MAPAAASEPMVWGRQRAFPAPASLAILSFRQQWDTLIGEKPDFPAMAKAIRYSSGRRFFDPANAKSEPSRIFELSLDLDRCDFILCGQKPDYISEPGLVELIIWLN